MTANVLERKSLFQVEKIARLFIEVMMDYRTQKKFLLHEFVVMPDHFHLIIAPNGITLERSMGGWPTLSAVHSKPHEEVGAPLLCAAKGGIARCKASPIQVRLTDNIGKPTGRATRLTHV